MPQIEVTVRAKREQAIGDTPFQFLEIDIPLAGELGLMSRADLPVDEVTFAGYGLGDTITLSF